MILYRTPAKDRSKMCRPRRTGAPGATYRAAQRSVTLITRHRRDCGEQNQTSAHLAQAIGGGINHWIVLKLTAQNRTAPPSSARAVDGFGRGQMDEVRAAEATCRENDLRLHFGLGPSKEADRIEIEWPSGARQTLSHVKADQSYRSWNRLGRCSGMGEN